MDTLDILKSNEIFCDLSNVQLEALAQLVKKRSVPKNTLVISVGDTASSMYIIKEGRVNVTLSNEQGKEIILTTLTRGDHFGELSLLDDEPRSANVLAAEKCEFLILNKQDFFPFLLANPAISISIIKYLCRHVRLITNIAEGLALTDVYGRLVKLLMDLAEPDESGKLVVSLPLTHKEISMRVGSSREMVSKIISELEKGNYLITGGKKIIINKKLPLAW